MGAGGRRLATRICIACCHDALIALSVRLARAESGASINLGSVLKPNVRCYGFSRIRWGGFVELCQRYLQFQPFPNTLSFHCSSCQTLRCNFTHLRSRSSAYREKILVAGGVSLRRTDRVILLRLCIASRSRLSCLVKFLWKCAALPTLRCFVFESNSQSGLVGRVRLK